MMIESQIKLYIRYLLSEKNGKCSPEKLLFLSMKDDVNTISSIIISTFRSLNGNTHKQTIDPLSGAYTSRYFFKLLKKIHISKTPFNLILLNIKSFYITENPQKNFFRDSIIENIGTFFKKYFRDTDLIGRLGPPKFMLLILTDEDIYDIFEVRIVKILKELKIKFPSISSKDITWKHLYINSKEDLHDQFKKLNSIKYNSIINLKEDIK